MIMDYLTWYKDLETGLQDTDAHLLMSSSVCPPISLLRKHLDEFCRKDLSALLSISNAWGYPPLLNSIAQRYGVQPENVAITNGVSNAIYLLCRLLLSPKDHVLIESPVYEPLVASPHFIGCEWGFIKRRPPGFLIDPDDLHALVRPNTKLLILSNLHNPSGALLSDDLLLEIAAVTGRISPDVMIVVDEVYRDCVAGATAPSATLDDRFISFNSLTKSYGLGSLHTGWIIGKPSLIRDIKRLHTIVEGSGATLLEAFASYVVDNLHEYRGIASRVISENRRLLCKYMAPLLERGTLSGDIPEHGCVYFPRVNTVDRADSLVEELAARHRVFVVPGRFFGEPSNIRIGFGGATEGVDKALALFAAALT